MSRFCLSLFFLICTSVLVPNSRAEASDRKSDDSIDWNDIDEYTTSEWGPVSDGLSIRVVTPNELSYGMPITMLLERRIDSSMLPPGITRWTGSPEKVKYQLDIFDSPECPGECTQRYVYGSSVRKLDRQHDIDFTKLRNQPIVLQFKPDKTSRFRKSKAGFLEELDLPSYPLVSGNHKYRLKMIVSDSKDGSWNGVAETLFGVRVARKLVVRKKLTVIVPHGLELRSPCRFGFTLVQLDTVVVFPKLATGGGVRTERFCMTYLGPFVSSSATQLIRDTTSWQIRSICHAKILDGALVGAISIQILDMDGVPPQYLLLSGGETLWERHYKLALAPEQIQALDSCQH